MNLARHWELGNSAKSFPVHAEEAVGSEPRRLQASLCIVDANERAQIDAAPRGWWCARLPFISQALIRLPEFITPSCRAAGLSSLQASEKLPASRGRQAKQGRLRWAAR